MSRVWQPFRPFRTVGNSKFFADKPYISHLSLERSQKPCCPAALAPQASIMSCTLMSGGGGAGGCAAWVRENSRRPSTPPGVSAPAQLPPSSCPTSPPLYPPPPNHTRTHSRWLNQLKRVGLFTGLEVLLLYEPQLGPIQLPGATTAAGWVAHLPSGTLLTRAEWEEAQPWEVFWQRRSRHLTEEYCKQEGIEALPRCTSCARCRPSEAAQFEQLLVMGHHCMSFALRGSKLICSDSCAGGSWDRAARSCWMAAPDRSGSVRPRTGCARRCGRCGLFCRTPAAYAASCSVVPRCTSSDCMSTCSACSGTVPPGKVQPHSWLALYAISLVPCVPYSWSALPGGSACCSWSFSCKATRRVQALDAHRA